jgi:DNA-binding FrmR family transcriptional regulator
MQTDDEKLRQRVRRIRGQVDAIERALESGADSEKVMQLAVSVRGAVSSLMAELIHHHVCGHISDPSTDRDRVRARGAKQLIDIVRTYLK